MFDDSAFGISHRTNLIFMLPIGELGTDAIDTRGSRIICSSIERDIAKSMLVLYLE